LDDKDPQLQSSRGGGKLEKAFGWAGNEGNEALVQRLQGDY